MKEFEIGDIVICRIENQHFDAEVVDPCIGKETFIGKLLVIPKNTTHKLGHTVPCVKSSFNLDNTAIVMKLLDNLEKKLS